MPSGTSAADTAFPVNTHHAICYICIAGSGGTCLYTCRSFALLAHNRQKIHFKIRKGRRMAPLYKVYSGMALISISCSVLQATWQPPRQPIHRSQIDHNSILLHFLPPPYRCHTLHPTDASAPCPPEASTKSPPVSSTRPPVRRLPDKAFT